MSIKRNVITGGAIAVVAASALFTVGQRVRHKTQPGWNRDQWLRLLSGSKEVSPNGHKSLQPQADWNREQWLHLLSGTGSIVRKEQTTPDEAQAGWNQEQWLRLLSGSNSVAPKVQEAPRKVKTAWDQEQWLGLFSSSNGVAQKEQIVPRRAQPGWNQEQWFRLISGSDRGYPSPSSQNGGVKQPTTPAEFIGRTGYQLYR